MEQRKSATALATERGWALIRSSQASSQLRVNLLTERIQRPTPLKATFSKRTPSSPEQCTASDVRTRIDARLGEMTPNELALTELFTIAVKRLADRR